MILSVWESSLINAKLEIFLRPRSAAAIIHPQRNKGGDPLTDRELLEIIATQVGKLTADADETKKEMRNGFNRLEVEIRKVSETVSKIEVEHGQKLGVLLNGYKQNAERLDRVEAKLVEHDEIC